MTETELKVMAALAIMGLSSSSKKGYSTPAAIGIPSVLYMNERNSFCRMFFIVARLNARGKFREGPREAG